ncbi:MAG: hypothetical protein M3281_09720, partial [Chloroflexota bacterium]|nr:hypothetical protein [Chloroflexota bacterium]
MTEVRLHWPGGQVPACLIVDDPTPCRNPAWYEFPKAGNVAVVPNRFAERFADLMDSEGVAGKFSVVPCPGAQGRIDQGLPGVAPEELSEFLGIVRERIAPRWSLSPELLTHNYALDIETFRPLPEREDAWIGRQDEPTLTRYVSLALQILRNVGLEPDGVTSPWLAGIDNEDRYTRAISAALRDVCGVSVGWYFVHSDWTSPYVEPKVARLDTAERTALVSLVAGSELDFAWFTQRGETADIDSLATADGQGGRLSQLFAHRSPM